MKEKIELNLRQIIFSLKSIEYYSIRDIEFKWKHNPYAPYTNVWVYDNDICICKTTIYEEECVKPLFWLSFTEIILKEILLFKIGKEDNK